MYELSLHRLSLFFFFNTMRLLKFEGYNITVEPEALLIKSIRKVWSRDRSAGKAKALLELGYIYFMVDPRSTYSYIADLESRSDIIIEEEGLPQGWQPDEAVQQAMESYARSVQTTSQLLLEDTKIAVDNLRLYLRSMDFNKTDDKGKPIYSVSTLATAVNQVMDLSQKLIKAEEAVSKEIMESTKMRGQRSKNIFEDGV